MSLLQRSRRYLTALALVCVLLFTTACTSVAAREPQTNVSTGISRTADYGQLARGNSQAGQEFGSWVVKTGNGLIKDAFVRDNDKLGVVISSQVRPTEVKDLAKSLTQGFRKNFPNKDLSVLVYAPDKKLILTARYDAQTKQIEYQQAS